MIDYTERTARHVMIPRADIHYLSLARPLGENLGVVRTSTHTRFPLTESDIDHVVGMVHVKDLFNRVDQLHSSEDLELLKRDILFVPEGRPLDALQRDFQQRRTHIAIVVDGYGGTSGLVTLEDVIEEIVGEIQDEYDSEEPRAEAVSDHEWLFDAGIDIDDVNRMLNIHLPTDTVDTLAGLVFTRLGKVPEVGEQAVFDDAVIEVLALAGRRIRRVRVMRQDPHGATVEKDAP